MLANVLISLSVAVAILVLLDFFMSDSQKKACSHFTLHLWNWLDEMKKLSFLAWLRRKGAQRWCIALATCPAGFYLIYNLYFELDDWAVLFGEVLISVAAGALGAKMVSSMFQAQTAFDLLRRATMFLSATIVPLGIVFAWRNMGTIFDFLDGTPFELLGVFILVVFTMSFIPTLVVYLSTSFVIVILPFWLAVVVPLLATYFITIVLFIAELVVRRIAEYPKGPVLAGSALFGGIVALIKVFT